MSNGAAERRGQQVSECSSLLRRRELALQKGWEFLTKSTFSSLWPLTTLGWERKSEIACSPRWRGRMHISGVVFLTQSWAHTVTLCKRLCCSLPCEEEGCGGGAPLTFDAQGLWGNRQEMLSVLSCLQSPSPGPSGGAGGHTVLRAST